MDASLKVLKVAPEPGQEVPAEFSLARQTSLSYIVSYVFSQLVKNVACYCLASHQDLAVIRIIITRPISYIRSKYRVRNSASTYF